MPYYKRKGGSHYRREHGQMRRYGPGDIIWMEEHEVRHFRNVFELVDPEAGRAAMRARGLDPAEVEGQVSAPSPPPPPEPEPEVEEETITAEETVEPPPQIGLELKSKGGGWWDVINLATGQPINDKALRKSEAEALVAEASDEEAEETTAAADPVGSTEDMAE